MRRSVFKAIKTVLAALSIVAVLSVALILEPAVKIYGYAELDVNRLNNIKKSLVIYGNNGASRLETADFTPIDRLNEYTIDAFLSAEDKRFYDHEGIDYARILSAVITDVKDRSFSQGASTITQQLIKNSHLSNQKNLSRKIQEIRLSRAVERIYGKKDILEMYLNILYFGNGIYGIGNAARNFFGKNVEKLSVKESAMLASIINNPTRYNPYNNYENLNKRTDLILKMMRSNGKLSETQYEHALAEQITIKAMSLYDKYKYFVMDEACKILGCTEEYLLHGNIKIYCNCDFDLQSKIANCLSRFDARCLQVIVIENNSGRIIAHEAKYDGDPCNIIRSPGSTIKPIVCYAPALEKGLILPITPILDEKTNFGDYKPSNYKNKYNGWVSCKYALKESLNIPAVKLLDYVGLDYAKEFASKMGIATSEDEGLSLALGGMKYGVTLKQLASAYSIFARGGMKKDCSYIKAIYMDDKLIYSAPENSEKVMSEDTAYFINEMLNECAKTGTAKRLNAKDFVLAAKTGTVGNDKGNTDAYCIAYTPDHTIGVHVMQTDGNITGGGMPTNIAKELIMSDIIRDKTFDIPSNIVKMDIDAIQYHNDQKIVAAKKSLPKKDRLTASFSSDRLPQPADERSDYEKGLEFFDMNNFTIVDSFGD